jgi:PTS system glucitol/sorbitol-specific IIA component
MTYYRSTIIDVGPEAVEMAAAGVIILFGEPLPEALAEVSVVHRPSQTLEGHVVSAGDVVTIGDGELEITSVGDLATKNLDELGHIVLYVNQSGQKLLPGAVNATGTLPVIEPGQVIEFRTRS